MKNNQTILEAAEGDVVKCAGCGADTILVGGFVRDQSGGWVKAEIRPYHSCGGK